MSTYSTCDVCFYPLDLCTCHECQCGKKIHIALRYCSEDCRREMADDHIRGERETEVW